MTREHKPDAGSLNVPAPPRDASAPPRPVRTLEGDHDPVCSTPPHPGQPAFRDDESGRVTLSLDGPPLALPGEALGPDRLGRRSSRPEPQYLDAWSADRLRRSSLPPSAPLPAFSTAPPVSDDDAEESSEESDILKLVSHAPRAQSLDLVTEMTERFALGDFSGALRAAELLLGQHPEHPVAQHYAHEAAAKLEEMYTSRLSPKSAKLEVTMPASEIAWLGLDPQVGALLALIDGQSTYEMLLSQCGMPRLWALRALSDLLDARVIRLL